MRASASALALAALVAGAALTRGSTGAARAGHTDPVITAAAHAIIVGRAAIAVAAPVTSGEPSAVDVRLVSVLHTIGTRGADRTGLAVVPSAIDRLFVAVHDEVAAVRLPAGSLGAITGSAVRIRPACISDDAPSARRTAAIDVRFVSVRFRIVAGSGTQSVADPVRRRAGHQRRGSEHFHDSANQNAPCWADHKTSLPRPRRNSIQSIGALAGRGAHAHTRLLRGTRDSRGE